MSFPTSRVTSRILPEGAPPPRYGRFAIHFDITANTLASVDIRSNAEFKKLCVAFESVELLECDLEFNMPPSTDKTSLFAFGFGTSGLTTGTLLQAAHTVQGFVSFNSATTRTISLPADHNFGRELKATVLGNSIPIAYAFVKELNGCACLRFRACFHGSALG